MTESRPTILVPVDGSPESERAIPVALALARERQGSVRVVHVFVPVAGIGGSAGSGTADADEDGIGLELQGQLRDEARAYLRSLTDRLAKAGEHGVACDFIDGRGVRSPFGEAASVTGAILRHAEKWSATHIVMTTHGRGGPSRAWLGSVADGIARESRIPLILVRAGDVPAPIADGFTRILVPLDGSAPAREAIAPALALRSRAGARLTLLRVVPPRLELARPAPVSRVDSAAVAEESAAAERELAAIAEQMAAPGVAADVLVLVDANPARAILEVADRTRADLIAMSTHGRGGIRRVLLGSVADKVVRAARTSVLLVRRVESESGEPGATTTAGAQRAPAARHLTGPGDDA
ncbi:MAG TPA: universal stress protein [Gemmatimonadaceae bacterium]